MKRIQKVVIVTLICLNIGLLVALIHFNTAPAYAQPFRPTNFLVVTTKISSGLDALCVIDLNREKLATWKWNKGNRRLELISTRELPQDFRNKRRGRR